MRPLDPLPKKREFSVDGRLSLADTLSPDRPMMLAVVVSAYAFATVPQGKRIHCPEAFAPAVTRDARCGRRRMAERAIGLILLVAFIRTDRPRGLEGWNNRTALGRRANALCLANTPMLPT